MIHIFIWPLTNSLERISILMWLAGVQIMEEFFVVEDALLGHFFEAAVAARLKYR